MSKFEKGDKVANSNTNEKGIVIEVYPPRRGQQLYKIKYDDGRENDERSEILSMDVDLTDPFERCRQNYYDHYTDFLKTNTSFKIRSSNNSTISSLKASRTLFRPYQFKPLLKFLNSGNRRLLIADEVGLGKTIEAGHIMLELKARGELKNALVICPLALRAKWATELNDKFGLGFIEVEDKRNLIHELKNHEGYVHLVTNYDQVREDSDVLKLIEEKNIKFSIVVCDESHKLRNSNTKLYHGIERLLIHADSIVFMSATPIMLDEGNLYNQLHLLDADLYDNLEVFKNSLVLNKPFVRALGQLNSGIPLQSIAEELLSSRAYVVNTISDESLGQILEINDYYKDYPLYKRIVKQLTSGNDCHSLRAQLQQDLSEMSPMNNIFSRTRKREVTSDWSQAERCPHTEYVSLSQEEREAYDEVIENYTYEHCVYDEYGRENYGGFGMVTLKRQLASSVWACKSNNDDLDTGYDCFNEYSDSKYNALLSILKTVFSHGNKKIIVFAIFKKTLKYLSIRLNKSGYRNVIIYGDPKINKNDVLLKFQHDDSIQVLLSSEVGSEGLDMQFCNSIINYDLPWNPMVVEQRIGRIDRFGQESQKVNIYNIVVNQSILEDIYSRLLMRIGIFRESIGDLEAILDSQIDSKGTTIKSALKSLEHDFYSDTLTIEEVNRKKEEIERAIENERLNLKELEKGLTNTLTNDSYFRDEINKIVNNNAYVTGHELYFFVTQLIKEALQTCTIEATCEENVYEFRLSKSDPKRLKNFLLANQPADNDSLLLFKRYINSIEDELTFLFTFDQEKAFKDKSLTFINIYHPLIKAGVKYFESNQNKTQCTFFFGVGKEKMQGIVNPGHYILAIYKIAVSRTLFSDSPMITESLFPVLYDISNKCIVDDNEIAEQFMGKVQLNGFYIPMEEGFKLDSGQVDDLRYDMKFYVEDHVNYMKVDMFERLDNSKRLRYQQTIQYYESRERNYEAHIKEHEMLRDYALSINDDVSLRNEEKTLRLLNGNLRDLQKEKEADLVKISRNPNLNIIEGIKSLNLINVI